MNAFSRRKKSVVTTAVAVPACLLLAFGGTALLAAPALADSVPATSTTASATPSATATATGAPSPSAPAAPTTTHAVTPVPTSKGTAPLAPTDLSVTSPVPVNFDDENQQPTQMTSRTFTIEGSAPVGSELELDDWDGDALAKLTTTATTFSIPVTIAADAPYEQFLDLYGTHGRVQLTDVEFDLVFPADTSAAPTLNTPAVTSFTVSPLPFGFDTFGNPVKVTGTGTPGDYVELAETDRGATPDTTDDPDDPYGDGSQFDVIPVGQDGSWTGYVYVPYGTTDLWAAQQQFLEDASTTVDEAEAITHTSSFTGPLELTMQKPAGTVDAPVITRPADPDTVLLGGDSSDGSSSTGVQSGFSGLSRAHASTVAGRRAAAEAGRFGAKSATTPARTARATSGSTASTGLVTSSDPFANVAAAKAAGVSAKDSGDPTDDSNLTDDQLIAKYGIQVKGTPVASRPGYVSTTVSGTGTPGDHIVLYAEDGDTADTYVQALYPEFFSSYEGFIAALMNSDGSTPIVPPTFTAGTDTSLLPADTGSITVAANGTWTTTITRKTGSYGIMAFAVDPATKAYSAAGDLLGVHLTGDPATASAPAATGSELAFTGSQHSTGIALGGLGAVVAGGALLVVARRRRRA